MHLGDWHFWFLLQDYSAMLTFLKIILSAKLWLNVNLWLFIGGKPTAEALVRSIMSLWPRCGNL